MERERILVVHVAGIGDAAVASTVAERLRHEQPDASITWVCGAGAAPVVELFDGVDRVVAVDQERLFRGNPIARMREIVELWRRLGRGFDRAVVLHPDPRFRVLVLHLVGIPKVFLSRSRRGDMNPIPGRFHGDEYARLAGPAPRAHAGPIERRYPMADVRARVGGQRMERSRMRVSIIPGGARNVLREDPQRRWPIARYVDVAAALLADGCEVVLLGAKHDDWVRAAFAGLGVTDRVGQLSLVETLAALCDSDLVVAHDTGPLHLARLVRTPVLALFGPTIPTEMLWIDESVDVLWGGEHLACRPCYDGRHFARCSNNLCMQSIAVDDVVAAARRMLAAATV